MYYTLLFGEAAEFSIQYRPLAQESQKNVTVKGIQNNDILTIFANRYPEAVKEDAPISVEYKEGIPVLTINQNLLPGFLEKTFKEFAEKKVQNLIIDLRYNGGGSDDYGKMLFAYLIDKPFRYYKALEIKNNTFSFFKYTNIPPEQIKLSKDAFKKNQRGWYDTLQHPNLGEQQPLKPAFKGKGLRFA